MIITETRLRKIVREEILRESTTDEAKAVAAVKKAATNDGALRYFVNKIRKVKLGYLVDVEQYEDGKTATYFVDKNGSAGIDTRWQ